MASVLGVTWTGIANSRRKALGVKVDWAYAPGDVKILTSSDGANFEEAKCWQTNTRTEVAFEESFMFAAPRTVKAVTIAMRSPRSWGYFGINSATLIAEPGPFMLVRCVRPHVFLQLVSGSAAFALPQSGITTLDGEQCLVVGSSGIHLEPCLEAIAAGDGREVLQLDGVICWSIPITLLLMLCFHLLLAQGRPDRQRGRRCLRGAHRRGNVMFASLSGGSHVGGHGRVFLQRWRRCIRHGEVQHFSRIRRRADSIRGDGKWPIENATSRQLLFDDGG